MKLPILGGTGSVGTEVLRVWQSGGTVLAPAGHPQSIAEVIKLGATPISGDFWQTESWLHDIPGVDGVIQMTSGDLNNPYWQGGE